MLSYEELLEKHLEAMSAVLDLNKLVQELFKEKQTLMKKLAAADSIHRPESLADERPTPPPQEPLQHVSFNRSITPDDSSSEHNAATNEGDKNNRSVRPPGCPAKVLWYYEDSKNDPDVCPSNRSRPRMFQAMRKRDGSSISRDEWKDILRSAHKVKKGLLNLLSSDNGSRSRSYFRNNFPDEWRTAIEKMERSQPLLTLCSEHWKAEHVLSGVLYNARRTVADHEKGEDELEETDDDEPSSSNSRKRCRASTQGTTKRRKTTSAKANSTETQPSMSKANAPSGSSIDNSFDVNLLKVSPSINYLRAVFFTDFPGIPHADDLLKALEERNLFEPIEPSNEIVTFLERIESADPNGADISQDDANANWGHYQFTAENMTCATVIASASWDQVGVVAACRLLAAAITTCKVARYICVQRKVNVGSYLSDTYLRNLVEMLWEVRRKADNAMELSASTMATNSTTDDQAMTTTRNTDSNFVKVLRDLPAIARGSTTQRIDE